MIIKRGVVVSHAGAIEWGVGKIVDVTPLKATIQFSDGIVRKIASSHYTTLLAANPASYVPIPVSGPAEKVRTTQKRQKKVKQPAA